jgi:hypothetical protein
MENTSLMWCGFLTKHKIYEKGEMPFVLTRKRVHIASYILDNLLAYTDECGIA